MSAYQEYCDWFAVHGDQARDDMEYEANAAFDSIREQDRDCGPPDHETSPAPTFGEVLAHGTYGPVREYPPESGETAMIIRLWGKFYAVPTNEESYALSDPAEPYLS